MYIIYMYSTGQHSGVASTAGSQQDGLGFYSNIWLGPWVCIFSPCLYGLSLCTPKHANSVIRLIGESRLPIGVKGLSDCTRCTVPCLSWNRLQLPPDLEMDKRKRMT